MSDAIMPAAFLGHGSPMNALERNRFTAAWRAFGEGVGRPRAILVVSAHWYVNVTAVTAMSRPRTIHDFYGFPRELFEVQYPAPGDPALAAEVADLVETTSVGLDADGWGLDHGTWSVLVHAFPAADVPVVQLSIDQRRTFEQHLELAAQLAPLRARGVLILGSGNVVHNLRELDWAAPDLAYDWARRFDDAAREVLAGRPGEAARLQDHADFRRAHPTPDHFIPLLHVAGLAAGGRARRAPRRWTRLRLDLHGRLRRRRGSPGEDERRRAGRRPPRPARDPAAGHERVIGEPRCQSRDHLTCRRSPRSPDRRGARPSSRGSRRPCTSA